MDRVKKLIHANKVYRRGYTGRGIRIAVLDTGCLRSSRLGENPVIFRDFVNKRSTAYDDNGHGTHVCGILSARSGVPVNQARNTADGASVKRSGNKSGHCENQFRDWSGTTAEGASGMRSGNKSGHCENQFRDWSGTTAEGASVIRSGNKYGNYENQIRGWSGIAPGAELVVLKILDEEGNGSTDIALKALEWVMAKRVDYKIRLLNFSVGYLPGGSRNQQRRLLEAVDALWDAGVAVVAAAGNNGPGRQSVTIPGVSRRVITVGASDDRDRASGGLRRGYSGRGPTGCCIVKPEILAPGTGIRSLGLQGDVEKSGTSMAVPVVCGALALALEQNPSLTPAQLKLRLYQSVESPGNQGRYPCWGMLDVDTLLELS